MKILKFTIIILFVGLIYNNLSAQTITSYSGKYLKINKYPTNHGGIEDKIYMEIKFAATSWDQVDMIQFGRYSIGYYGAFEVPVTSKNGKYYYTIDGTEREIKDSGIVLDCELTNLTNFGWNVPNSSYNRMWFVLYNGSLKLTEGGITPAFTILLP